MHAITQKPFSASLVWRTLILTTVLVAVLAFSGCAALTGTAGPTPTPAPTATPIAKNSPNPIPVYTAPCPCPTPYTDTSQPPIGSLVALPSIADLVDKVEPAVVNIVTEDTVQTRFGTQQSVGSGSGIIFQADGYILTNNHVIEGSSSIKVTLSDARQFDATEVGADPATDLAVIKIDQSGLPILPFGDASKMRVGDWVIAIGNAAGLEGKPSVTLGIVSALDRSIQTNNDTTLFDLIQTDAVINPGNSGGPLLNLQGEVVGINSVILRGGQFDGIGFAISTDTVRLVADQLLRNGKVVWPRMGVYIADIDQPTVAQLDLSVHEGVLITQLEQGGPAESAGLQVNDVIVALDGKPTPNLKTLQNLLQTQFKVGQRIKVTVVRGKDRQDLTLTLAQSTP